MYLLIIYPCLIYLFISCKFYWFISFRIYLCIYLFWNLHIYFCNICFLVWEQVLAKKAHERSHKLHDEGRHLKHAPFFHSPLWAAMVPNQNSCTNLCHMHETCKCVNLRCVVASGHPKFASKGDTVQVGRVAAKCGRAHKTWWKCAITWFLQKGQRRWSGDSFFCSNAAGEFTCAQSTALAWEYMLVGTSFSNWLAGLKE